MKNPLLTFDITGLRFLTYMFNLEWFKHDKVRALHTLISCDKPLMITVKELTKRYARNNAVDHISFEVGKGQIVGFLGPNGAGKTTTMRMLTCFLPPTSGGATVAGYDVLEQSLEVKKRIGYLPETPPLYPEMETGEYLIFVGKLKGLSGAELRKRVDYVCDRCAVADVKNKLLGRLSKGIASA
jgi:ABC-2 type transport system ATP-binding protein